MWNFNTSKKEKREQRKMKSGLLLCLVLLVGLSEFVEGSGLKENFYEKSCPHAEEIVREITWNYVATNVTLPPKFLRLHFHDCFVRGCDGSILIDSTPNNTAEKAARPNLSLAGFGIIDEIKEELEQICPGVVSCADILALVARDSVSFQYQMPLWEVPTGRRDGRISNVSEVLLNIPSSFFNFTLLEIFFARKNLTVQDLVVLSGGHTIGVGHCQTFSNRLYNFTGKDNPTDTDPSLNKEYLAFLKTKCKSLSDNTTFVPMDPGSFTSFDNHYFKILEYHEGLFQSDAALLTNKESVKYVYEMLDSYKFFSEFRVSIKKMGEIQVLTGTAGEIRKKCNVINH